MDVGSSDRDCAAKYDLKNFRNLMQSFLRSDSCDKFFNIFFAVKFFGEFFDAGMRNIKYTRLRFLCE